jgi:hypothetical protein
VLSSTSTTPSCCDFPERRLSSLLARLRLNCSIDDIPHYNQNLCRFYGPGPSLNCPSTTLLVSVTIQPSLPFHSTPVSLGQFKFNYMNPCSRRPPARPLRTTSQLKVIAYIQHALQGCLLRVLAAPFVSMTGRRPESSARGGGQGESKLQREFLDHCARLLQSHWRGHAQRKRYRQFLPIYRRFR